MFTIEPPKGPSFTSGVFWGVVVVLIAILMFKGGA